MEREARRKLKLCFINVLELANTHQQRYSSTAEIASIPQKKKALILMHCLSPSSENLSNLHQTNLKFDAFWVPRGCQNHYF